MDLRRLDSERIRPLSGAPSTRRSTFCRRYFRQRQVRRDRNRRAQTSGLSIRRFRLRATIPRGKLRQMYLVPRRRGLPPTKCVWWSPAASQIVSFDENERDSTVLGCLIRCAAQQITREACPHAARLRPTRCRLADAALEAEFAFTLERRSLDRIKSGRLPERTNGAASKAVVASGSPWVRIPHLPPMTIRMTHGPHRHRRSAKNRVRISPHSSAKTPLVMLAW